MQFYDFSQFDAKNETFFLQHKIVYPETRMTIEFLLKKVRERRIRYTAPFKQQHCLCVNDYNAVI